MTLLGSTETDLTAAKPGGDTEYAWRVKRPVGKQVRWEADLEDEYLNTRAGWEYQEVYPSGLWPFQVE
jgi:uncharacterized membrane protein